MAQIVRAAFSLHQIPDHIKRAAGAWFIGAEYFDQDAPTPKEILHDHGVCRVFWLPDGRILDECEISEGSARRYAPVSLYETKAQAHHALELATERTVRALRDHERECVHCRVSPSDCGRRDPLAYRAAEYLTGIRD